MPLEARIDAPDALHHIIALGIERGRIFANDQDWDDFMERLCNIVTETKTSCFAWVLIPNHAHFLFQNGQTPLTKIMSRLLTDYAISNNRRHGHLFQSGWKSATN